MADGMSEKNEGKKLDWMYRDSSQTVDREEYLLGRKIDKQFENSVLPPDKEQECLPSSIFIALHGDSQVDVARKLQEDPLYLIKKKEIESREQLLKNPRKMKQLQEMLARQQAVTKKLKRKQMKKKKKKDIDTLLAKKCKQLFGGIDAKRLASLDNDIGTDSNDSDNESSRKKKKKSKDLDRLIALKYKKIVGKMDAKGIAELSDSSESESSNGNEKQNWKKPPLSSFSEESNNEEKRRKKKKEAARRNRSYSYSDDKSKSYRNNSSKWDEIYTRSSSEESVKPNRRKIELKKTKRRKSSSESDSISNNSNNIKRKQAFLCPLKQQEREHDNSPSSEDGNFHFTKESKCKIKINKKFENKDDFKQKSTRERKFKSKDKYISDSSDEEVIGNHKTTKSNLDKLRNRNKSQECEIKTKKQMIYTDLNSDEEDKKSGSLKSRSVHNRKPYVKYSKSKEPRPKGSSKSSESSSEEGRQPKKQYGLVLPANYVPKKEVKQETKPLPSEEGKKKLQKREQHHKLTEEEKQLRLKEMMTNAKWREELRDQNIKEHKEKMKAEKEDHVYNENFMRSQMALAMSHGTVESRVKANINSIQRGGDSMTEHFARRK